MLNQRMMGFSLGSLIGVTSFVPLTSIILVLPIHVPYEVFQYPPDGQDDAKHKYNAPHVDGEKANVFKLI